VKIKDKIINKFSYIQLVSNLSVDTPAVLQHNGRSIPPNAPANKHPRSQKGHNHP